MDTSVVGGLILVLVALPGVGMALALLTGRWRPASLATVRNPVRARVATGQFILVHCLLVATLGAALAGLPQERHAALAQVWVGAIIAATTLGAALLIRATRTAP